MSELTAKFSSASSPAGASGQAASPAAALTNKLWIAFGTLWTGDKTGEYAFTAECPSCRKNTRVNCSMGAGWPPRLEAVPPDEGPAAGDPNGTPMLRISNITYPNDDVSFTTYSGENNIKLAVDLKPDTPEYNTLSGDIFWSVEDSPADAMDSGNPADPANGENTSFDATAPAAAQGRLLPLKYKIQASVDTPKGRVKSYPRHIRQDDIDKCRQEYFDVSATGEDLRLEPYFSQYARLKFTPNVKGGFVNYLDCYAQIYPVSPAAEVAQLKGVFGANAVTVTSGYRSARYNKLEKGVWNSEHQFGRGVDIQPTNANGLNIQNQWLEAACPKILERIKPGGKYQEILIGECGGTGLKDWKGERIEGEFSTKYKKEGETDVNENEIWDILEDKNPKNGVADIFDIARVTHLGD